jgi:glycosyltransferase involved in cell wall biosynthesis
VLIAAYQAAAFIAEAVTSALDQDPPPIEVIVGDDGSTDDLAGALAPFGAAVRVVRIEHGGEGAAKNAAAGAATGDWLAFLDADDVFLPGRLAAIAALAGTDPGLDAITTDANLVFDGEVIGRCYTPGHPFVATDQRRAILDRNFVLGLAAVRRKRFEAIGGFDPSVTATADWDLWLRLIMSGSRIGFVPEPLAEYRLHEASMSADRAAMSQGRLQTLARAAALPGLADDEQEVIRGARRREVAVLAREQARAALLEGPTAAARSHAWRVAVGPGQGPGARMRALAVVVAPGLLGRRVRSRAAATFTTVGDRRLARPER